MYDMCEHFEPTAYCTPGEREECQYCPQFKRMMRERAEEYGEREDFYYG